MLGFGNNKQNKRQQLLLHDDNSFEFVDREVVDTFLVESKGSGDEKIFLRAWRHLYNNQFTFPGCQGVKAGQVTLSFERDVIYDLFGVVPETERIGGSKYNRNKTTKYGLELTPTMQWLADVGHARRFKLFGKRHKSMNMDKIITALFVMNVIGVVGCLLAVAMERA